MVPLLHALSESSSDDATCSPSEVGVWADLGVRTSSIAMSMCDINAASYDPPGGVPELLPPSGCAARNVYIDLGASWCSSLKLYSHVPEALGSDAPWQVYAFEPQPLIAQFVERCCNALTWGESLPVSPIPPAHDTSALREYGNAFDCGHGAHQLRCILAGLNDSLLALRENSGLSGNPHLIAVFA